MKPYEMQYQDIGHHEPDITSVIREKDALAAALASLLSAVAKYIEWNGRSCEYDEDEPDPECPTCQIDEELNRAFGEAMGCDKALVRRDAPIRRKALLEAAEACKSEYMEIIRGNFDCSDVEGCQRCERKLREMAR